MCSSHLFKRRRPPNYAEHIPSRKATMSIAASISIFSVDRDALAVLYRICSVGGAIREWVRLCATSSRRPFRSCARTFTLVNIYQLERTCMFGPESSGPFCRRLIEIRSVIWVSCWWYARIQIHRRRRNTMVEHEHWTIWIDSPVTSKPMVGFDVVEENEEIWRRIYFPMSGFGDVIDFISWRSWPSCTLCVRLTRACSPGRSGKQHVDNRVSSWAARARVNWSVWHFGVFGDEHQMKPKLLLT